MGDDRESVYVEDGKVVYRASSVGMCDQALIAIRQGVTPMMPPEWLKEKMDEGTAAEGEIVEAAREQVDGVLVSTQDTVEVEVTDSLMIRGHTDGMMKNDYPFGDLVVEAKKLGPSLWAEWEKGMDEFFAKMPYYRDQATVYMYGAGAPMLYAAGKWDPDEKRIERVEVRVVEAMPGDINEIKGKLLGVEAAAASGVLPECAGVMYPCPVFFLHEGDEREDAGHDKQLVEVVDLYLNAQGREKEAKAEKDHHYTVIEQLMEQREDKVEVPGLAILTKYTHKSTSLDNEAVKAAGIDLSPYKKTSEKPRVKVTPREE